MQLDQLPLPNAAAPDWARAEVQTTEQSALSFEDALSRAGATNGAAPSPQVAQVDQVPLIAAPSQVDAVRMERITPGDRALQGLELGRPSGEEGGSILSGLEHLRGIFDGKITELDGATRATSSMTGREMIAMQTELVKYTLLIDVTSKLAGKTTQAADSLMKGQ